MSRTLRALVPLLAAGVAATALSTPALAGPVAATDPGVSRSTEDVAHWKAAHDTDPHVPLSAAARADLDRRTEAARRHLAARPEATSRTLTGTQQAQRTSYWCGPAAVSGALAVRHVSLSQTGTANLLRTTTDGTDWSGTNANVPKQYQTGYPVADVLTYKLHSAGATYHPVGLSYDPTAKEKSAYRTRLVTDIDNGWDMVGDAWEAPGGPHLVGHPGNQEIFHWFTIRGYSSSGAYTQYQDSVHGASSISWSSGVPAYSTMSSDTITTINGGRGYVW
ncbi:C39 family peptidase [Actinocatenispora rupis]|uniref:Peptidase C39-like domain-containing protein n=1 Tax=Actinocatenispora rupis TaxID=519421 RepID=A0A8J3J273_9ACTN|nr:C39 family peptidase [Actinocatenispora rupis]GID10750.1 hypothetical protein Aru02nite_16390 [Actinocatenispora rupis]